MQSISSCRRGALPTKPSGSRGTSLVSYVLDNDKPAPQWLKVFTERPSPLALLVSPEPRCSHGLTFHTDLLTPGVVEPDDPPPITSGMSTVDLDHQGHLTYFEAIPRAAAGYAESMRRTSIGSRSSRSPAWTAPR